MDYLYYANLQIGTPPQALTVDIDTGSADLWVTTKCKSCSMKQYNSLMSKTFLTTRKSWTADYAGGGLSGYLGSDNVTIGNYTVDRQDFALVSKQSTLLPADSGCTGLIGLAFSSVASSKKPTFIENLINASENSTSDDNLSAPLFSVYMARAAQGGSELCLGCVNPTKYNGPTVWAPLVSRSFWTVEFEALQVSTFNGTIPALLTASIDTGSTLAFLPYTAASALWNAVPGAVLAPEYGYGRWSYPCGSDTPPLTISFVLSGVSLSIDSQDLSIGADPGREDACIGGVLGLSADAGFPSDFAVLGDIFLKSWYTTFDYSGKGRIGFTRSIDSSSTLVPS